MPDTNWFNLIAAARTGDERAWRSIVEHLRPQLREDAARQLSRRLRRRTDPSDVVQQSLTEAWVDRGQFAGSSKAELEKWLRRILERNLQDAVRRHIQTDMRSVDHERSFDELLSSGDFRPEVFLAEELSPARRSHTPSWSPEWWACLKPLQRQEFQPRPDWPARITARFP
jgi:DNA-directed RNA polymerase specialized sigma24 family protein